MGSLVGRLSEKLFCGDAQDRRKWVYLTLSFFCVIAAYTIAKELKDSIFAAMVGREYIPIAKQLVMLLLVPAILFYSKLVDRLRRYRLLFWYSLVYGILGIIFAVILGHSTIGLPNTDANPWRIFGWIFYFFVEGYSPFVVGVFWAYVNSISNPKGAKNNYGIMVAGSKLGGMVTSCFAWYLLSSSAPLYVLAQSDAARHQFLLFAASVILLMVPILLTLLMRRVSGRHLHGYEAAYQVEKERGKKGTAATGIFSGIKMLIKYPYILGIFCVVYFYEIINTVLSYQRVGIAQQNSVSVSQTSSYLFKIIFITHFMGFCISLFGTKALMQRLGERLCLLLVPIATALLFIYFMFSPTQFAFLSFFVLMRSIHYGFSYPVRESLYIPTIKEMKFKSKSFIDAFGSKFAKSSGSVFNFLTRNLDTAAFLTIQSVLFFGVIGLWISAAYLLGKRFDKAVKNNEVIGID